MNELTYQKCSLGYAKMFVIEEFIEMDAPQGTKTATGHKGSAKKIRQRQRLEQAPHDLKQQLNAMVHQAIVGIAQVDLTGRFVLVNQRYCDIVGRPLQQVLNLRMQDITHPEDLPRNLALFERAAAGEGSFTIEKRYIRPDGSPVWVHNSVSPVTDPSGKPQYVVAIAQDITERRREEQLRSLLAAIVESTDDAVIGKTLDGTIVSWNAGAQRIYGYSPEEVIGRPISVLVPASRPDELPSILERLKRGELIDHFETVRVRKDGKHIDVSVSISPIKDAAGAIIGASAIARDISDRKRFEAERSKLLAREQQARVQAEAANRAKDEFLATVSHELRTPLNAMLGWARMLRADQLDAATSARALEAIERNAKSQAQLIEDLLDVSRIISGKLRLDVRSVELPLVIEAAVDAVRPAAEAKEIRLQKVLDPQAGPVSGDPDRLQQVVWNLLSNAVKFTPRGGRVQVRLERVTSHIEVTVSDTGRGISTDFLPFLFDRFRQEDGTPSRKYGGLGLGLAIVRHLVELHGGTVSAESSGEGQGATFRVSLPLMIVSQLVGVLAGGLTRVHPTAGQSLPFDSSPVLENVRVLVVDDEPDAREILTVILEQCGAQVKAVGSAPEAWEALQGWKPRVLLADIGMPGEDGYALIRRVRALPPEQGGNTPAAALTAFARTEDRVRALSAGFQIHVPKPVEPAELVAVVQNLARQTGKL
jgi:PAS domain S-box-containing protein